MDNHWLVRPRTIRILWVIFIAILAATVLAEFAIKSKGHFGADSVFGFNAWYGFGACIVLIIASKMFGVLIKRKDTYYDE